jgi:hypothetical protein
MGNAPISPRERHDLASIPEVSSSQEEGASEITQANSVNLVEIELESTQDEPGRYLPKMMHRFNTGVIMPSKPYGCGGASTVGGIESPQWGWYISISPPTTDMHHCGSRTLHTSSANTSQVSSGMAVSESSTATSHQPNRIFKDIHNRKRGRRSDGRAFHSEGPVSAFICEHSVLYPSAPFCNKIAMLHQARETIVLIEFRAEIVAGQNLRDHFQMVILRVSFEFDLVDRLQMGYSPGFFRIRNFFSHLSQNAELNSDGITYHHGDHPDE